MTTSVDIGCRETLSLRGALLLYRGKRSFVTWHEARESIIGIPCLGEAQPLSSGFVGTLADALRQRTPIEVLPENLLVRTAETIVWWSPAAARNMFIRSTGEHPLSANRYPHPPLVWKVTGHNLWVRAIRKNMRPVADTPLFVAPYWNINGEDGLTCQGSMRSPEDASVVSIPQWERAFFQSEFTHATGVRPLTNHPGGFVGLWASLADSGKPFPTNRLVSAKQTLLEFVQEA